MSTEPTQPLQPGQPQPANAGQPTDEQLLAGVVNRMGTSELTLCLDHILKRLSVLEGGAHKTTSSVEGEKQGTPGKEKHERPSDSESRSREEERKKH